MTDPFFVVGSPRSGTTLLVNFLNKHDQVFVPPETAFFVHLEKYGYSKLRYTSRAGAEFIAKYLKSKPATLLGLPAFYEFEKFEGHCSSWGDVFMSILYSVPGSTSALRGEKTPHHLRSARLIHDCFPAAKFISVVRDGRAVVNSRIKHPNWSSDVVEASVRWTTDANWEFLLGEICGEENVLRVHYESFLKEPEFIEARLLEFIGATASSSPHSETQAIYGSYNSYFSQPWMQKRVPLK